MQKAIGGAVVLIGTHQQWASTTEIRTGSIPRKRQPTAPTDHAKKENTE